MSSVAPPTRAAGEGRAWATLVRMGGGGRELASRVHMKARDRALADLAAEQAGVYQLLLLAQRADPARAHLPARSRSNQARTAARLDLREVFPARYWELYDEHVPAVHREQGTVEGDRSRRARQRRDRERAAAADPGA